VEFSTDQERFWAGEFGNDYIERNSSNTIVASNLALFARILKSTVSLKSIIEFGSNVGLNLLALGKLLPESELHAVEINSNAVQELRKIGLSKIHHQTIFDFIPARKYDLVFTKGVLIHINPDCLPHLFAAGV